MNLGENEYEQLFPDFFNHISIAMAICHTNGTFIRTNDTFCKLTGFTKEELLEMAFNDITHPDDLSLDSTNLKSILHDKLENFSIEKRIICKNKALIWVTNTVALIRNKN